MKTNSIFNSNYFLSFFRGQTLTASLEENSERLKKILHDLKDFYLKVGDPYGPEFKKLTEKLEICSYHYFSYNLKISQETINKIIIADLCHDLLDICSKLDQLNKNTLEPELEKTLKIFKTKWKPDIQCWKRQRY